MKTQKAREAIAANPATTVSSIGIVVAAVGYGLGWSQAAIGQVTAVALVATPVVSQLVQWWQRRRSG